MKIIGIYKITSPSRKVYIGKSTDIFKRWRQYSGLNCKSQTYLYNSLLKYGFDKHKFEVICQCDKTELNNLERYYIALHQCFNSEYGLNLREGGGKGETCSDETRKKLSDAALKNGNKPPINSFKGFKHSDESKAKMSESSKGRKSSFKGCSHTDESNEKNRKAHLGKKASEETKQKLSIKRKEYWDKRRENGTDKKIIPLTNEQRKRLSESLKGKKKKPRTQEHIDNLKESNRISRLNKAS